jgi:hypothetical protein
MFRAFILTIYGLLPLAGSGCAIVEVGMRNPVVGLETVAVAPFFNLSQERTVDGREFALAYYAELQKVPGFEVLPVGVTERAMVENGISLTGPDDAVRLAQILDVDAVVIGAVTDYDPYNPRIGLKVAWYSPRQFLFLANEDPTVSFFNRSADAPARQPGRPKYGSTPRAQSPDNSDTWVSADFEPAPFDSTVLDPALVVEDGNWETVGEPLPSVSEMLLAQAELPQLQPFLPDGTSLLVPVADANFPTLPLPRPAETHSENEWQSPTIPISYQGFATSDEPIQAPPVDEVVPVQGADSSPPVDFVPPLSAQPIIPTEPALPGNASSDVSPEPIPRPDSPPTYTGSSVSQPASTQPGLENPFNRHIPGPSNGVDVPHGLDQLLPDTAAGQRFQTPPRIAAAEPEFPGSNQKTPTQVVPPQPVTSKPESQPAAMAPVMKTPLFPMQRPEVNPSPMAMPRSTIPALAYDEHVVVAPSDFEPTEPLMAYVRLLDATDRRLIARLSDYLELTGQLRSGDLEAYMKRSEFFRKFTAHVMISEMLQLHGGEARRQLVLKPRKYR